MKLEKHDITDYIKRITDIGEADDIRLICLEKIEELKSGAPKAGDFIEVNFGGSHSLSRHNGRIVEIQRVVDKTMEVDFGDGAVIAIAPKRIARMVPADEAKVKIAKAESEKKEKEEKVKKEENSEE